VVHHSKSPKRAEKKPEPKEEPREEEPSKETAKDSTPETEAGTLPRHPDKKPKTDAKTSHPKGKPHHATEVDLTHKVERRVDASSAAAADRAEADAKAGAEAERAEHQKRAALANSLRTAAHTISAQGSTSTEIAMPGDLGPEFANYNHLIFSKYKLRYDQAVLKAGEFAAENLSVQVSITIARDGKVTEKKLTAPSGNRVLDRLVRQVIDEVKSVAPFPPETHDTERTFEIIFNLKPNRQI
jgi:TonB family protein